MFTFLNFRSAVFDYVKTTRSGGLVLVALLFCLLTIMVSAFGTAKTRPLKVGVIGDQTGSADLEKSYEVLGRGVEILNREGVACVLHTGDLLESRVSPEQYRIQFEQAVRVLDKLRMPWHLAPGDHEVNPPERVPNSSDRSREQLFRVLYGKREPQLTKTLSHSFDVGGYHFIALSIYTPTRVGVTFSSQGLQASRSLGWKAI